MTGAEVLVAALEREGVDVVFGYPGGAIMPVYDALYGSSLRHILVRHEQGAVLAADGYARATGRVGVCLATSGPGATNLVTGIANASLDSVPLVAITGQVPTALMGTDAFQEVDIFGMTLSVVKHSTVVRRPEDLPDAIRDAFRIARSGRPGPVLVDLPKDVASAACDFETRESPRFEAVAPDSESLRAALRLLKSAARPVVYAGGGIGIGGAVDSFRRFVEATRLPVVTTLKGIGVLPTGHELALGMIGMHGSKAANLAVQASDLLVAVGVRFDDRATGKLERFAPGAKVIHLDIDGSEVGKLRRPDVGLVGELVPSLAELTTTLPLAIDGWREACLARKAEDAFDYDRPGESVYAPRLLRALTAQGRARERELVVTCDVGQHQMWVAQHGSFSRPEEHLSSGGLGTMGYGLPAAIGAQLGRPKATVVNVTGDGSFMMNVQELATVRRYRLPVKIVLLDNQALGLVRQWQELFFGERYSEVDLSDNPDFVRLAESFGIPGFVLDRAKDEDEAVERLLAAPGPALLHVRVEREANVWPLVPPNRGNEEMLDEPPTVLARTP
jgi:acetolactate synthase I/II/III large subunit